jgi:hypothetical protein
MPAESFSSHLAGKDSESAAKSKAHRYLPEFNFCLAVVALRTIRIPWFNIVSPLPMLLLTQNDPKACRQLSTPSRHRLA